LTDQSINSYRDLRVWQDAMLETRLLLAERVGILPVLDLQPILAQCENLGKMLRALIRSLQDKAVK
jgi:hypothetical protein